MGGMGFISERLLIMMMMMMIMMMIIMIMMMMMTIASYIFWNAMRNLCCIYDMYSIVLSKGLLLICFNLITIS